MLLWLISLIWRLFNPKLDDTVHVSSTIQNSLN